MSTYKTNYDKSYALLVAIDKYKNLGNLNNAVRGANTFAKLLEKIFNFEVTTYFDEEVTADRILEWFALLKCNPDDRVIFYFAGHGLTRRIQNREWGYLALPHTPQGRYDNALKLNYLIQEIEMLAAKHVLVTIDACFSGLVLRNTRSQEFEEEDEKNFIDKLISRPVRFAITAGDVEPVDDNASPDGTTSLFAYYLVKGLQGEAQEKGGLIRARTLATYLEKKVASHLFAHHKPNYGYISDIGDGDFVFQLPNYMRKNEKTELCTILDPAEILDLHTTAILQQLKRTNKLVVMEKISIGQSGLDTYLVDLTGKTPNDAQGFHICRIYRTPNDDLNRIYEAIYKTRIGPYIPKLGDSTPSLDGWIASLYTPSRQVMPKSLKSLSNLIHKNLPVAIECISRLIEVLIEWNPPPSKQQLSTPLELLKLPFQHSTFESENVVNRIETSFMKGFSRNDTHVQFANKVLPNPIAFISFENLWQKAKSILWPCGIVHGALNSNNIICILDSYSENVLGFPIIIDFGEYDNNGSLFFDLAYLEIDLAVRMLSPNDARNREIWLDISEYLVENIELQATPPFQAENSPLYALLTPIRSIISVLCKQQPTDFEITYWIARTSVCLSFARKRKISSFERNLVLLLAAHSLEKTLNELHINHNDHTHPAWMRWFD